MDCNDSLYAGDPKLVVEVAKLVHTLMEQVMEYMKGLGATAEVRHRGFVYLTSSSLPPSLPHSLPPPFHFLDKKETVTSSPRALCQVQYLVRICL